MFHLVGVLLSILGDKQAYLDPGSGSFLLQLLIAGLLGAALVLRTQWSKIKKFFNRKNAKEETEDEDSDEA
jgi:F0F1-type ATP synthase assembly protein I